VPKRRSAVGNRAMSAVCPMIVAAVTSPTPKGSVSVVPRRGSDRARRAVDRQVGRARRGDRRRGSAARRPPGLSAGAPRGAIAPGRQRFPYRCLLASDPRRGRGAGTPSCCRTTPTVGIAALAAAAPWRGPRAERPLVSAPARRRSPRTGVVRIVLLGAARTQEPHSRGQGGRDVDDRLPSCEELLGQEVAHATGGLHRPNPVLIDLRDAWTAVGTPDFRRRATALSSHTAAKPRRPRISLSKANPHRRATGSS